MNPVITAAGIFLVSLPFIGIFAIGVKLMGWKSTTVIILGCVSVIVLISIGVALVFYGLTGSWAY